MRYKTARSVDAYEKIEQVGEGTYGEVFMARSRDDSSLVALKKVKLEGEKEGFPITAIREVQLLARLDHPCPSQGAHKFFKKASECT